MSPYWSEQDGEGVQADHAQLVRARDVQPGQHEARTGQGRTAVNGWGENQPCKYKFQIGFYLSFKINSD